MGTFCNAGNDIFNSNTILVHLHQVNLHTLFLQIEPGVNVAGKFTFSAHNYVSWLPVQSASNHHQPIPCAGSHPNLVRSNMDHVCHTTMRASLMLSPAFEMNVAEVTGIVDISI